jgi:glycosyltransferase involved in cell wall biosynthesis
VKIGLVANTDWYLFGYRKDLASELKNRDNDVVFVSPSQKYTKPLIKHGFKWTSIIFSRHGVNPIEEAKVFLSFFRTYRQQRFDLVHHFTIKAVIYGSIAAKLLSVQYIFNSITGLGTVFTSHRRGMKIVKRVVIVLYRIALSGTTVIFQNRSDLEYMVNLKLVPLTKCKLVRGSGVDSKVYYYSPEPGGLPAVLLTSRMIKEKGIWEYVKAAEHINSRKMLARFVLVGAPDEDNPSSIPKSQLMEWARAGLIEWLGWREDVPDIIRSSNIVCLPTAYGEGLPKILLEAGAIGRAVVATDIPACRAIIRNGVNGLLVPPNDVEALTRALMLLIGDAEMRRSMGIRASEIVGTEFTTDKVNAETIALYPKEAH